MRKMLGRTVAAAALAAAAITPLAGVASASPSEQATKPAAADRCWFHHGGWHCNDWHHGNNDLLDLDADLDLDLL